MGHSLTVSFLACKWSSLESNFNGGKYTHEAAASQRTFNYMVNGSIPAPSFQNVSLWKTLYPKSPAPFIAQCVCVCVWNGVCGSFCFRSSVDFSFYWLPCRNKEVWFILWVGCLRCLMRLISLRCVWSAAVEKGVETDFEKTLLRLNQSWILFFFKKQQQKTFTWTPTPDQAVRHLEQWPAVKTSCSPVH